LKFLYIDENRRQKAISALLESPSPVRSPSIPLKTIITTDELNSTSTESKEVEEEVMKIKPSQLPLMNQV
jgi:hypothetical protein